MRPIAVVLSRALLGIAAASMAVDAHATGDCPHRQGDWIELQFDLTSNPAAMPRDLLLRQLVVDHLRAEFASQGIEVCASPAQGERLPLATLRVTRDTTNAAEVRAWANDTVTQKELSRKLSLEGLPQDSHAMAIALGASELVAASWMELRLASRNQDQGVPESVSRVVTARASNPRRVGDVALLGATEGFFGGVKQLGVDMELAMAVGAMLDATARLGARSSLMAESKHGSVSEFGWLLGVGLKLRFARPAPSVTLTLQGQSDFMWVTFVGLADRGAVSKSAIGHAWWISAGLGSEIRIAARTSAVFAIHAGQVILPLTATDDGAKIMGIAKGLVAANGGIRFEF